MNFLKFKPYSLLFHSLWLQHCSGRRSRAAQCVVSSSKQPFGQKGNQNRKMNFSLPNSNKATLNMAILKIFQFEKCVFVVFC